MAKISLGMNAAVELAKFGSPSPNKRVMETTKFVPGNKLSAAENLTEHANTLKLKALARGWEVSRRKHNGEKVVTAREIERKIRRKRLKLKETVAKEAVEIQEIARTHAAAAMERLAAIVNDEHSQDSAAIQAISVILDRAYGKASQTNVNANVNLDGKPTELSAKQLDARVAATLKRVEAITGAKGPEAPDPTRPTDIRKLN